MAKVVALKNNQLQEVDSSEVDYALDNPARLVGVNTNQIPLQSAVHGARDFYGQRFMSQALPIVNGEAPLVQNMDIESGQSFDELVGTHLGALRSDFGGTVKKVTPDYLEIATPEGETIRKDLYNRFFLNRKSMLHQTPLVKKGDTIEPGQLLAKSNYTDDQGRNAMGLNARIGIVPYKGYSMDDAIVISDDFAKRLTSETAHTYETEYSRGVKGGRSHYTAFFRDRFTKDQLDKLDKDGVVQPGTLVHKGDPLILATKPRQISSNNMDLGSLSRYMQNSRSDASEVWGRESPGIVVGVTPTRKGTRVNVVTHSPTTVGDKITMRNGQKGIVSKILEKNEMPRTEDGTPLDVLLNKNSIPSRVNSATPFEIILGKIAAKRGEPIRIPSFTEQGTNWPDIISGMLEESGLTDAEPVYDPSDDKWLAPITVGNGYIQKLVHEVESKISHRGQGSYDAWEQPSKGGFEGGNAKRFSGLEAMAAMSAGAYANLREGATLRGQRNDAYWRALRMGQTPQEPGAPFAWDKFMALLQGAGYHARKLRDKPGSYRIGFLTDRDLEDRKPFEIQNGELLDMKTLTPKRGGLFDDRMTVGGRWGKITLPHALPNPAAEVPIRKMLGLTESQFRDILAGRAELPDHIKKQLKR